jgi:hypothetical protein
VNKPVFVFDDRSLEKINDIREQGFMSASDFIMEQAKATNDVYLTAYRAGQEASKAVISRLCGAIEDYLDGETQGNVAGLRQAIAAAERGR